MKLLTSLGWTFLKEREREREVRSLIHEATGMSIDVPNISGHEMQQVILRHICQNRQKYGFAGPVDYNGILTLSMVRMLLSFYGIPHAPTERKKVLVNTLFRSLRKRKIF